MTKPAVGEVIHTSTAGWCQAAMVVDDGTKQRNFVVVEWPRYVPIALPGDEPPALRRWIDGDWEWHRIADCPRKTTT